MSHLAKRIAVIVILFNISAPAWVLAMDETSIPALKVPPLESIVVLPDSRLELFGDSTIRKFSSTATEIRVGGKIDVNGAAVDGLRVKANSLTVSIPVTALKSDNGTLDEHLRDALKADRFPEIRGVLKAYKTNGKGADGAYPVNATIDLTIAGTTKTMPVEVRVAADVSTVRIKGEKSLLMTDFNVDPPTLMLGVIKVASEIVIRFDLSLSTKQNRETRGSESNAQVSK